MKTAFIIIFHTHKLNRRDMIVFSIFETLFSAFHSFETKLMSLTCAYEFSLTITELVYWMWYWNVTLPFFLILSFDLLLTRIPLIELRGDAWRPYALLYSFCHLCPVSLSFCSFEDFQLNSASRILFLELNYSHFQVVKRCFSKYHWSFVVLVEIYCNNSAIRSLVNRCFE